MYIVRLTFGQLYIELRLLHFILFHAFRLSSLSIKVFNYKFDKAFADASL